jgi:hypothetical protein
MIDRAAWHLWEGVYAYIEQHNREVAFNHAKLAAAYWEKRVTPNDANHLGYMLMAAGQYDSAAQLLQSAQKDPEFGALAQYNCAILNAMTGLVESASVQLEELLLRFESHGSRDDISCLFCPQWSEGADHLDFVEVWTPSLPETASRALDVLKAWERRSEAQ